MISTKNMQKFKFTHAARGRNPSKMSQPRKEEVCQEIQLEATTEADGHKIGHKFAIKICHKNCDAKN